MSERRLYVHITTKPLHEAAEKNLPAVEHVVELGHTSGIELMELMRQSARLLGGDRETH